MTICSGEIELKQLTQPSRKRLSTFFVTTFILFLLGYSQTNAQSSQDIVEPKLSGKTVYGKLSFDKYCASCHGKNGAGTSKGPTFLHRVYHPGHHGDQAFFLAAKNGAKAHHWRFGNMPPVAGVTDQQLDMIVAYVRALQKANGVF